MMIASRHQRWPMTRRADAIQSVSAARALDVEIERVVSALREKRRMPRRRLAFGKAAAAFPLDRKQATRLFALAFVHAIAPSGSADVVWVESDAELFAARIERALELGCRTLVTETGEVQDKRPGPSYRNILRNSFAADHIVAHRLRRRAQPV